MDAISTLSSSDIFVFFIGIVMFFMICIKGWVSLSVRMNKRGSLHPPFRVCATNQWHHNERRVSIINNVPIVTSFTLFTFSCIVAVLYPSGQVQHKPILLIFFFFQVWIPWCRLLYLIFCKANIFSSFFFLLSSFFFIYLLSDISAFLSYFLLSVSYAPHKMLHNISKMAYVNYIQVLIQRINTNSQCMHKNCFLRYENDLQPLMVICKPRQQLKFTQNSVT